MRSPRKSWLPALLLSALTCLGSPAPAYAQGRVEAPAAPHAVQDLHEAVRIFRNGGYPEAAARLNELLYPLRLSDREDILLARVHLALCYSILDDPEAAAGEFRRVLDMDPEYTLDPLYTPPDLVAFFEALKASYEPPARPTPPPLRPPEPRSNSAGQLALDLAPFGIAQLRAQRPAHAALLLSGEVLLGATATGTWLWLRQKSSEVEGRDPPYFDTAFEADTFVWVRRANFAAFGANTALFIYGFTDALLRANAPRPRQVTLSPGSQQAPLGLSLSLQF